MNLEFNKDFVGILHSLLNSSILLLLEDVWQLSITCKNVFHELSPFINKKFLFRYPGENNSFQWYHPQRLRVGGCFGASLEQDEHHLSNYLGVNLPPKHFEFHPNLLPSTLTHLTFGPNFNSPIDNLLPHSLTHLSFDNHDSVISFFNQPIDHLPPSLTHLSLTSRFNQPIDLLPQSLLHLALPESNNFEQPINHLPHSLTHLSLGYYNFQYPVSLPHSLKYLSVHHTNPVHALDFLLPNLTTLDCSGMHKVVLPSSLLELTIDSIDSPLPNLQALKCKGGAIPFLPSSLLSLETIAEIDQPLPPKLQAFTVNDGCSFPLPLPSSLTVVHLNLDGLLPPLLVHVCSLPNLQELTFRYTSWGLYNCPPLTLPASLIQLTIHDHTLPRRRNYTATDFITLIQFSSAPRLELLSLQKQGLRTSFFTQHAIGYPQTLTSLHLENTVFQGQLPPTLRHLDIQANQRVDLPPLPNGLISLTCGNCQVSSFPSTLKYISLDGFVGPLPPLPPDLLELTLSKLDYDATLPPLPSSLRKLDCIIHPFPPIPPRLKYLRVGLGFGKLPDEFPLTLEYIS